MYHCIYYHGRGQEFECSGVGFRDFYAGTRGRAGRLLLLKSEFFGDRLVQNFEVLEGGEDTQRLLGEYGGEELRFGDLHLLDYSDPDGAERLSEEEIKELLYASHTWRIPPQTVLDRLGSRFVRYSHDDDWYCKLHLREPSDFFDMLACSVKTEARRRCEEKRGALRRGLRAGAWLTQEADAGMDAQVKQELYRLGAQGVFIDIEAAHPERDVLESPMYVIGVFSDMDEMFLRKPEAAAKPAAVLRFDGRTWSLR